MMSDNAENEHRSAPPRSAVVVAHPDDEALWFSAILDNVERVIFCFEAIASCPAWTDGRKQILERYPLTSVESLRLPEAEVFDGADWCHPIRNDIGLRVERRSYSLPGFSLETYRANYAELYRQLHERLRGMTRVYTHNPWGEYGHEEHIQVYTVIKALQKQLGFELWSSNYFSNKSYILMCATLAETDYDYYSVGTNRILAEELRELYRQCGCWTWYPDYVWPAQECFISARATKSALHQAVPLNFIRVEAPRDSQVERPWTKVLRRLTARAGAVEHTSSSAAAIPAESRVP